MVKGWPAVTSIVVLSKAIAWAVIAISLAPAAGVGVAAGVAVAFGEAAGVAVAFGVAAGLAVAFGEAAGVAVARGVAVPAARVAVEDALGVRVAVDPFPSSPQAAATTTMAKIASIGRTQRRLSKAIPPVKIVL
jgi:hypothetical protein